MNECWAMLREYALEIAIGAVAGFGLRQFYQAVAVKWPERYWDGEQGPDPLVTRTSVRYFAFRTLPFFLILTIAGAAASRLDQSRAQVVMWATVLYVVFGPGHAAVRAVFKRPFRLGVLLHRFTTVALLLGTAAIYGSVGKSVDQYVPTAKDVIDAVLIAVMIFVISSFGTRQLPELRQDPRAVIERSRREIPERLRARLNDSDPGGLFEAIAVAENINRPRWVRRAERALVVRGGSYGLMQVRARQPMDDEESVDAFIRKYGKYGRSAWEEASVRNFVMKINNTEEFFTLVDGIFWPPESRGNQGNL